MATITQEESLIEEQNEIVEKKSNKFMTFVYKKVPYLKTLSYPGKAEEIIGEVKNTVSDDIFEGCKLDLGFRVSPNFDIGHQFNVYTPNENSRTPKFSSQFVYSNNSTLLFSKLDSERRLFGRFDQSFYNDTIKCSFSNGMDRNLKANVCYEFDFKLPFSHFTFKGDNENTRAFSLFTAISKKISLGFEHTYLGNHGVAIDSLQMAVKNPKTNFLVSLTTNAQLSCNFIYKFNHLHLATDLMMGLTQEGRIASEYSIGTRYFFRNNILKFKVDSNGSIFGSFEEMLNPLTKVCLCTSMNYFTQDYKFGLGLTFSK